MNIEQQWVKITLKIKESDLVLKISRNVDPNKWDEGRYSSFLDIIFNNRNYQKKATETILRYFNSGKYDSLEDLAKENFNNSLALQQRYDNNVNNMLNRMPLKKSLSGTIDLATGTGKSYVMYALALIMLASKKVDRVLVLTPSVTIKEGLIGKFKGLTAMSQLNKALGDNFVPPKIINGSETMVRNSITIENRDAIYKTQVKRNSIIDSLKHNGEKTLLLNDEVHHVFYSENNNWLKFIRDVDNHDIKFKYILGFTGTAYMKDQFGEFNDYFPDVLYRYSLGNAIKDGFVKDVDYIDKSDIPTDKHERWQIILQSHDRIANKIIPLIGEKPITIIVTNTQRRADAQAREFKEFLKEKRELSSDKVDSIVLSVHSGSSAASDRIKLKDVDNPGNPVEFIFSVSMLTEGWDVKRVFQIVPDEKRAFNSKLLISQVMGRGLRIPNNWPANAGLPKVRIFNHEKWAGEVKSLVDEILEFKKIIRVHPLKNSKYNFVLQNVSYSTIEKSSSNYLKMGNYSLFKDGYVKLPSVDEVDESNTEFVNIRSGEKSKETYNVVHETFTPREMAMIMYQRFDDLSDAQSRKEYKDLWTIDSIERVIQTSLEKSSNKVITKYLKNKFLSSMNVINRPSSKRVSYSYAPDKFFEKSTCNLPSQSAELSSFMNKKTLFYTNDFLDSDIDDVTKFSFNQITDTTDAYRSKKIENSYFFKTPLNGVIATGNPEAEFVSCLTSKNVSQKIDGFIKSTDTGFYNLEYTWQKGSHSQNNQFNPDFLIKINNIILVTEIKDDNQIKNPDPENIGKYKYAIKHFEVINDYLRKNKNKNIYKFNFLTPNNFKIYFDKIKKGNSEDILNFQSKLDVVLANYDY